MAAPAQGKRFEQKSDEAFALPGGRERRNGGLGRCRLRVTYQLIEDNGDGLAQIHGGMCGAGGDAEQQLAVAEILVGQAGLLRTEEDGYAGTGAEMLPDGFRTGCERLERFLEMAAAAVGGADNEGEVRNRGSYIFEALSGQQDGLGVDGGPRFAERWIPGPNDAQMQRSKVGHGASGCADVERVARTDEDNSETIEFRRGKHVGQSQDRTGLSRGL